jgi:hypothetical protein
MAYVMNVQASSLITLKAGFEPARAFFRRNGVAVHRVAVPPLQLRISTCFPLIHAGALLPAQASIPGYSISLIRP